MWKEVHNLQQILHLHPLSRYGKTEMLFARDLTNPITMDICEKMYPICNSFYNCINYADMAKGNIYLQWI
jgi:hypothetical protein